MVDRLRWWWREDDHVIGRTQFGRPGPPCLWGIIGGRNRAGRLTRLHAGHRLEADHQRLLTPGSIQIARHPVTSVDMSIAGQQQAAPRRLLQGQGQRRIPQALCRHHRPQRLVRQGMAMTGAHRGQQRLAGSRIFR